jgi:hypothetical protein
MGKKMREEKRRNSSACRVTCKDDMLHSTSFDGSTNLGSYRWSEGFGALQKAWVGFHILKAFAARSKVTKILLAHQPWEMVSTQIKAVWLIINAPASSSAEFTLTTWSIVLAVPLIEITRSGEDTCISEPVRGLATVNKVVFANEYLEDVQYSWRTSSKPPTTGVATSL